MKPTLYCMAGIPGAGKSTFVDRQIQSGNFPADAFILDPDRTMQALSGYKEDSEQEGPIFAFEKWELKARDIAYASFEKALSEKRDIIIDMGNAREENFDRARRTKNNGYRVEFFYVACGPRTALQRIQARDRHTPEAMVHDRHKGIMKLLPHFHRISDRFVVLNNADLRKPFRVVPSVCYRGLGITS